MYKIIVEYNRSAGDYVAHLQDEHGKKMGDAYGADTKEQAIFQLGVQYGRYPQLFARPLGELLANEK